MTINTDSFGNKYFNKFSPQITRDTRCQIRLEIGELRDSMASLMPPGDFFENSINYFYIRFSNSTYENFTGNITISANYRFIVNLEYSRPGYINAGNPSNLWAKFIKVFVAKAVSINCHFLSLYN